MKNYKSRYIVVAAVTAVLIAIIYLYFFGETARVQKNMQAYLTDKYSKEFIVNRPVRTGNEGFGYNKWVAIAHPQEDLNFKLAVDWDIGEPGYYYDEYAEKKRSLEGDAIVGEYVRKLYGEDALVRTYLTTYKELDLLSFTELINNYGPRSNFNCTIYAFLDSTLDKQKEAEKAYTFYSSYVKENRMGNYSLTIFYLPKDYQNEFSEIFNKGGWTVKEGKLINRISFGASRKIDGVSSIVNDRYMY